ncbi:MAG: nitroreductase family protein [Propionibacteriaceae bacterium]|nr:nitroreductase family protein [Propionibacteriaceae bacterium]
MGTIDELLERKSVRIFEPEPIAEEVRQSILACAFAAPTAGNQMLYTILQIDDPEVRHRLAELCDHQMFIEQAPWVLVFLADSRRWHDAYALAGCDPRPAGVGDLMLACQDAMVAAQNAVVAAHAHGLGSCYIGDVLENREQIRDLLSLDEWVFPATVLILGRPTRQQARRPKPRRFDAKHIVLTDRYRRLSDEELRQMFADRGEDFDTYVPAFCARKYMSDFSTEMTRSVAGYLTSYESEPSGHADPV